MQIIVNFHDLVLISLALWNLLTSFIKSWMLIAL